MAKKPNIVVVENAYWIARAIKYALEDVGHVVLFAPSRGLNVLPQKAAVIREIEEADVVLLDNNLTNANYTADDILPFCQGKKVIGIGKAPFEGVAIHFMDKDHLREGTGAPDRLRELVERVLAD